MVLVVLALVGKFALAAGFTIFYVNSASSSPLSSGKGGGCNPGSSVPETLILTIPPPPSLLFPTELIELTGLALGQQGWMGSRAG